MADQAPRGFGSTRLSAIAAGAFAAALFAGTAVRAQEGGGLGGARYWFEESVRTQRARPSQAQRIRRLMPHRQFARPTIWHERPTPAERTSPQAPMSTPTTNPDTNVAAVPPDAPKADASTPDAPKPDAILPPVTPPQKPFVVAVIGDNLAQWLAVGLNEAFPSGSGMTIVNKTRDSSGLVRDDFYDWPKALRDMATATKPDAIVVMIGSNDRQPLRGAAGAEDPLSQGWEAIYGKRVEALVGIAKDKKIPVLWVGMPIMKADRYSSDIGAINEIDHAHAETAGATFINVFDAFADEKGAYSAFGPDVNGQIVKLRTGDGIHFTVPGARKLAHFVEGDLRRLRDAAMPPPAPVATLPPEPVLPIVPPLTGAPTPLAPSQEPSSLPAKSAALPRAAPEPLPERPAAGPVLPLTAAPSTPGGELLGKPGASGRLTDAQRAAVETLTRSR